MSSISEIDFRSAGEEYLCVTPELVRSLRKERPEDSHKGTYGHAIMIAGCTGMMGAANSVNGTRGSLGAQYLRRRRSQVWLRACDGTCALPGKEHNPYNPPVRHRGMRPGARILHSAWRTWLIQGSRDRMRNRQGRQDCQST